MTGCLAQDEGFYTRSMLHAPCPHPSLRQPLSNARGTRGVTLIEILVTLAILSIILAIGLPSFREMMVRNQVGNISTEFANDIARARTEAISRNSCVTICTSINTANALTGLTPTCAAAGNTNWQNGWIIFANPTCSTTLNNPTASNSTLIAVRQAGDTTTFKLQASNSLRRFTFESRGLTNSGQSNFTLSYEPESVASPHYRSICVSSAGRVNIKQYAGVSACP